MEWTERSLMDVRFVLQWLAMGALPTSIIHVVAVVVVMVVVVMVVDVAVAEVNKNAEDLHHVGDPDPDPDPDLDLELDHDHHEEEPTAVPNHLVTTEDQLHSRP